MIALRRVALVKLGGVLSVHLLPVNRAIVRFWQRVDKMNIFGFFVTSDSLSYKIDDFFLREAIAWFKDTDCPDGPPKNPNEVLRL